ncbi:MAG: hypothetical protein H7647_03030, partial [Candidatus Heimdallarchaeota archaeon]|nr:hypothetical protein [Candidatus Heimdallarchaeota archaeon]MCK4253402.1 hypothetical protein [Candidatus Heimdallarchaeota archaeon]
KAKTADWGLGFSITVTPEDKIVGHGGGYPGFITGSGLIQEKKIIIIVLTNAIDGPALTLFNGIKNILNQLEKKKKELEAKPNEAVPDFKDIIGFFAGEWGVTLFSQIDHKFVAIKPAADDPVEIFEIYKHEEGKKFTLSKEYPFSSPGQRISFIDGPDGEKIFVDSHGGKSKRFSYKY